MVSRLLSWSCGFPLFPRSHGVTQGPRDAVHAVCIKPRNPKLGKFPAFIVSKSKPAHWGQTSLHPSRLPPA